MVSVSPSDAQLLVQSAGVLSTKQEFESRQEFFQKGIQQGILPERNCTYALEHVKCTRAKLHK